MMWPALDLDGVTYRYTDRPVVGGVSLALHAGQFVGLLGPNGSGKSTLLRLAAGLLRPETGTVRLAGHDLATLGRTAIARQMALLPQDGALPGAFTGWEIVLMGRTPHLGWFAPHTLEDEAIALKALDLVGAAALAARRVDELSGGERQRILLARVLAQEPAVLLLDEPTVHLDLTHQLAMLDLVRSLAQTAGLAVLGVFHDVNLAVEYCDELVFIADGQVVAQGEPTTTLTAELIHRVYGVSLPIVRHPVSGRPAILPSAAVRLAERDLLSAALVGKPTPWVMRDA